MCDREKTSRAGSQINFIEFVVAPLYAQVGWARRVHAAVREGGPGWGQLTHTPLCRIPVQR